jgi:hypothetical protein
MHRDPAAHWARAAVGRVVVRDSSAPTSAQPVLLWPAVLTGGLVLAGAVVGAALMVVLSYAIDDSLPARAQSALAGVYLWKLGQGSGVVIHVNARIILVNCIAALFFAHFGSGAALLEGTLRARYPLYDRLERLSSERLARLVARAFPRLREIPDEIAREVAALALAFPFIALAANGLAIGILLGSAALAGSETLLAALLTFWPHGLFELPALLLAAAIGYAGGVALADAGRRGLAGLLSAARARLTSPRIWLTLAGIFSLLAIAGAVEPVPSVRHARIDMAALGSIIATRLK